MAGYYDCIKCGWDDGVHDVRGIRYQHPWLVLHRETGTAVGCYSRSEARKLWSRVKDLTEKDAEYALAIASQ